MSTDLEEQTREEFSAWARQMDCVPRPFVQDDITAASVPLDFPAIGEPGGLPETWVVRAEVDRAHLVTTSHGWVLVAERTFPNPEHAMLRMLRVVSAYPTLGATVEWLLRLATLIEDQAHQTPMIDALLAEVLTNDEYPPGERLLAALGGKATIPPAAYDPNLHLL